MKKKYQLYETIGNSAGASNKARSDVKEVATEIGFRPMVIKGYGAESQIVKKVIKKVAYVINLIICCCKIPAKATVMIQVPFLNLANLSHKIIRMFIKLKDIESIVIIHDVNELRGASGKHKNFYKLLQIARVVVSHNEEMTKFLCGKGISVDKVINLGMFDYLLDEDKECGSFAKKIIIGGNLDTDKVKYLKDINRIKGCDIDLYGPNYRNMEVCANIEYKGIVGSDKLPYLLNEGFGLVWDGESINTCNGIFGNYLRYNNPHKLSLYIASGIPVIIWSQAAEAEFVKKQGVGILVDSLLDLEKVFESLDENTYNQMKENVRKIRSRVVKGEYIRDAISKAISLL